MKKTAFRHFLKATLLPVVFLLFFSGTVSAAGILKLHSHGYEVKALQGYLQNLHYKITAIDGIFGKETEGAVLAFQRDQKLKVTGIVDASTWRAIKKAKPEDHPEEDTTIEKIPLPPTVESAPFLPPTKVQPLIATAKKFIGKPYHFGTAGPKEFDCSGYLQYIFAQNKFSIPRTADEQYKLGRNILKNQLTEGDLVFFTTYEPGASHCGLYLGSGKFIHASSSKGVRIDELDNSYWKEHYLGAKHIVL